MTDNATLNNGDSTVAEEAVTEAAATPEADTTGATSPVNIKQEGELVKVETISDGERSYPKPNGAFLFVILMMIFYFVYWTISYFEIFVIRGA